MIKHQGFKTIQPIKTRTHTIPTGTRGVFAGRASGSVARLWVKLGKRHSMVSMPEARIGEFVEPIEANTTTSRLIVKLQEHEETYSSKLTRPCRAGDVVKVLQRIPLSDGANVVKGQHLHCLRGGKKPTFEFFHPLKYTREAMTWHEDDVAHAIMLCEGDKSPAEEQFHDRTAGKLTWEFDEFDDIDAFSLKLNAGKGGITLLKREAEPVTYVPGDQDSVNARDVASTLKDAISLKDASMLGIHLRRISSDYLILSFAEYLHSGASRLMSYADYLWMADRAASADAVATAANAMAQQPGEAA